MHLYTWVNAKMFQFAINGAVRYADIIPRFNLPDPITMIGTG